ncbi:MAG: hypothetical protein AAF560_07860 [Acidobacteriota bacterium]
MIELPLLMGALLMLILWPDSRGQKLQPAFELDSSMAEDFGQDA